MAVLLLAVQWRATSAALVAALPYSSHTSLAKATMVDHPALRDGGATAAELEWKLEEEQREMLRRAVQLVEPHHHHDQYKKDGRDGEIGAADHHHSSDGDAGQPIVVRDIHPSSGPVGGGTTVKISAEVDEHTSLGPFSFIGRRLSCRFDVMDVELSDQANTSTSASFMKSTWLMEATVQSPTRLTCQSPKVERPMATRVSLVDATTGHVAAIARPSVSTSFVHYDEPMLVRLEPNQGPLRGGTVIRASVTGYAAPAQRHNHDGNEVVCRFGNVVVNATWIEDESMIECASPPAPRVDALPLVSAAFDVPFALSMNGGSDYAPSMLSFAYHGDVRVRNVEPARGSVVGSTTVIVTGDNIHLATDCAFGEMGSAYSYRDYEADGLHCVTPAVDMPQRVELRLKTSQGWVETGMQFVFEMGRKRTVQVPSEQSLEASAFPISILGVSPAFGPSTGGTNVTIVLNAAHRSLVNATLLCWFDDAVTMAEVLSDGSISCLSAPTYMGHGTKISYSNLSVSVDDVVANGILQFTYYQLLRSDIVALTPSAVDAKGGTMIQIDAVGSASNVLETLQSAEMLDSVVVRVGWMVIPAGYDSASNSLTFFAPVVD
jgi:hypothetical protein